MSRSFAQVVVLLLGVLTLLGQVAFTGHSLTAQHVICEEHGQLIHAVQVAPSAPVLSAVGGRLRAARTLQHKHGCALVTAASAQDPVLLTAFFSLPAPSGGSIAALLVRPRDATVARSPRSYAPKTSPPSV